MGSAAIGGVSAEIGGGDFWNGAMSGGVIALVNHLGENYQFQQNKKEYYLEALDGLELEDGTVISRDDVEITFMDYQELVKEYPGIQKGNAHYLGFKDSKHHVNFSISSFEETAGNIKAEGVHEIYGHGIKKWNKEEHYKAYWAVIRSKYWNNTTTSFRESLANGLWTVWWKHKGQVRMPYRYQKIIDQYY